MPGPVPKPAALRQRRNKAATASKLAPEARRRRAPSLPERKTAEGNPVLWHAMTRAWWRAVWRSPMAEEYLDADIHALYRLAVLVDMFWHEPTKELAAELRLEQQCFGLTPIDRRRLQWEVERGEQASTRTKQRQVRRAQAGDEDPRKALRVLA